MSKKEGTCSVCGMYNRPHFSECSCLGKILISNDSERDAPVGDTTSETLKIRGDRYGSFETHAELSQRLKENFFDHMKKYNEENLKAMSPDKVESVEMIMHKLARIANGDVNYDDNWRDIAGYAQLVVDNISSDIKT
jgi:hypothetical protein